MKGCKPAISCGNSLTNPCDVNAQCFVERDGSVSCQVGFYTIHIPAHTLYIGTLSLTCCLICLVSVELAGLVMATCAGKILTLMDTQMRNSNARMRTVKR